MADGDVGAIEFSGVQPDPTRGRYRHCYGVRGFTWSIHGSFERVYYFDPDYVDGPLRPHLENTIMSLWAVIVSELEAAIEQKMRPDLSDRVTAFLRRNVSPSAPASGEQS